ncbi:zinc finger RNA-binding protein [Leptopilina heterotoma]|uniref:zinc finger RNA-binding protein n=1 Tax=Leptopilina heterotoma TaxID=63436 RepID=UPI001CA89D15|nr:zinc finger RNA-binding protein [Leptopilina heterotoma]
MAQNNYFGFTHGGTQYGATSAAAYQTGQAGYAVTPAATAATYTQRPAAAAATGYETYQAAAAAAATGTTYAANPGTVAQTYDYGYGRAAPAATYDATKTYYQQPAAAPATYTTTETHYQAAKPAYSTTSAYTGAPRQATTTGQAKTYQASSTAYQQSNPTQSATYSSGYTAPPTPAATPSAATNKTASTAYSGYDAALYSAATMYVAQQTANTNSTNQKTGGWQGYGRKGFGSGGGGMKQMRPKQPPKPQQLHYCDVCKISCAGPQTYREHLEGQKHKKKEASLKVPQQPPARGAGNSLRCELCDVTCTGNDAYAAHIRGAKHQKVVKLHTKLGKPIPSADPTVLNPKPAAAAKTTGKKGTVTATPKINFVASGNLGTVNQAAAEVKIEDGADDGGDDANIDEKDIQPVGQEYIEENKSDDGKIISFNCKLCECRFNDPNAKDMHMKGRRHRFAYKKKVNPDLVVDMKPSLKQRKMLEEKLRRQQVREEYMRRREEMNQMGPMGPMCPMMDEEMMYWEERRRYEEECEYYEWYRRYGRGPGAPPMPRPFPGPPPMMMFPGPQRRPDSSDDKHVLSHHSTIYPKEEELQAVQKIVSHTEKALKFVSDTLAEGGKKPGAANNTAAVASTPAAAAAEAKKEDVDKKKNSTPPQKEDGSDGNLFSFQKEKEDSRILRGVMRVGNLAKGLLLSGDNHVCLVVLCAEKPTRTLLNKVAEILPAQLKTVAPEDSYNVGKHPESAALTVSGGSVTVSITLTSPLMRDTTKATPADNAGQQQQGAAQPQTTPATPTVTKPDPPDVLPKAKCLEALAALRHAKWFQARATSLQSCVMVIRIMRDLCNRVPTWGPLNPWALELLTEKVISTAGGPLSPGEALRRLLECVAGGILLPGGPGLSDPCEKDPIDAIGTMTAQQREDITSSAQHALRLVAFRQIHKVLGMEQLPPPKYKGRFARKRRRDNSNGEGTDSETSKKDKKAEEVKMETDSK